MRFFWFWAGSLFGIAVLHWVWARGGTIGGLLFGLFWISVGVLELLWTWIRSARKAGESRWDS
jgi:hypothetical protein